jgi:hypothetical protein
MKTNTAIIGGDVTGNIGSCSVVATDISTSLMYQKTVAVNSCTGIVVSESPEYLGAGAIIPLIIFGILFFVALISWITQ